MQDLAATCSFGLDRDAYTCLVSRESNPIWSYSISPPRSFSSINNDVKNNKAKSIVGKLR